ncbi:hypothetical protein QQS21_009370 [Conoideocrella luteorostrata]|uniref:alpha-L-fucosidase n=1 Tax=Conoideocrella luteorostrata TaxID=1105319 RepID=A0AAJ0CH16_9HYPO|nr:hypothetical protein QQS21_009370 [Conoideocrella luteorostrata]
MTDPSLLVSFLATICEKHVSPIGLQINKPNITSKWFEGSDFVQIIEVYINNTDPKNYLTEADNLYVRVQSKYVDTVIPGTLKRLALEQAAIVQIGVKSKSDVKASTDCTRIVIAKYGGACGSKQVFQPVSGSCSFEDYTATNASVNPHLNPDWFNDIKYGIFIHYGPCAVPAYGNGDFFANFTDKGFDPKEWVDLFADAGAPYFVPTTKHHDGFTLFNFSTSISRRSSIHYGPKKDIIRDLFAAAKKYQPHLRLGENTM